MSRRVTLARGALGDVDDIEAWLAREASARTASRMLQRILDRVDRLAWDALTGTPRPEYGENTRFVVVRPYVIYYDVVDDAVTVLRILHRARDRDAIMRGEVQEEREAFAGA